MQAEAVLCRPTGSAGWVVSWRRATSCRRAEDGEAFPQRLRVHAALAWRPCAQGKLTGAGRPAEPALPHQRSLAARGPSAQTTAACLLSAAPRQQSGASSRVRAKQLLPLPACPLSAARGNCQMCPHHSQRQKRGCGNGVAFPDCRADWLCSVSGEKHQIRKIVEYRVRNLNSRGFSYHGILFSFLWL